MKTEVCKLFNESLLKLCSDPDFANQYQKFLEEHPNLLYHQIQQQAWFVLEFFIQVIKKYLNDQDGCYGNLMPSTDGLLEIKAPIKDGKLADSAVLFTYCMADGVEPQVCDDIDWPTITWLNEYPSTLVTQIKTQPEKSRQIQEFCRLILFNYLGYQTDELPAEIPPPGLLSSDNKEAFHLLSYITENLTTLVSTLATDRYGEKFNKSEENATFKLTQDIITNYHILLTCMEILNIADKSPIFSDDLKGFIPELRQQLIALQQLCFDFFELSDQAELASLGPVITLLNIENAASKLESESAQQEYAELFRDIPLSLDASTTTMKQLFHAVDRWCKLARQNTAIPNATIDSVQLIGWWHDSANPITRSQKIAILIAELPSAPQHITLELSCLYKKAVIAVVSSQEPGQIAEIFACLINLGRQSLLQDHYLEARFYFGEALVMLDKLDQIFTLDLFWQTIELYLQTIIDRSQFTYRIALFGYHEIKHGSYYLDTIRKIVDNKIVALKEQSLKTNILTIYLAYLLTRTKLPRRLYLNAIVSAEQIPIQENTLQEIAKEKTNTENDRQFVDTAKTLVSKINRFHLSRMRPENLERAIAEYRKDQANNLEVLFYELKRLSPFHRRNHAIQLKFLHLQEAILELNNSQPESCLEKLRLAEEEPNSINNHFTTHLNNIIASAITVYEKLDLIGNKNISCQYLQVYVTNLYLLALLFNFLYLSPENKVVPFLLDEQSDDGLALEVLLFLYPLPREMYNDHEEIEITSGSELSVITEVTKSKIADYKTKIESWLGENPGPIADMAKILKIATKCLAPPKSVDDLPEQKDRYEELTRELSQMIPAITNPELRNMLKLIVYTVEPLADKLDNSTAPIYK